MEEDIRKQGMLYLQQQRFGKKWKRVWCVLFRESSCSVSRLEFFECKDGGNVEKNDKSLRKQQEHKKVIRLSDCIRVSEVEMDGCPRDTGPFLVETTDKIYVFAADRNQLDDWTHKLCEIAFPMSWMEPGVKRGSLQRAARVEEDEGMEDNFLYSGRDTIRDFRVSVRRTEASDRCRLKGDGVLRADGEALHLLDRSGDFLFTWPYRYLRRFGRDKSTFSFEAGRRCDSGEGSFEFDTKQGNLLFQAVEAAINQQKVSAPLRQTSGGGQLQAADGVYSMVAEPPTLHPVHHKDKESPAALQPQRPPLARLEPPVDKTLTGVKSLTLDPRGGSAPRKNQVKMISSCPLPHESGPYDLTPKPGPAPGQDQTYSQITLSAERQGRSAAKRSGSVAPPISGNVAPPITPPLVSKEPEYSLPFDTIAGAVMADLLDPRPPGGGESADPLYDSIDEMKIRNVFEGVKVEHIYDEPEGCAAAAAATRPVPTGSVYDDPEEMRGDAWRIMGTPADPKGHEYPYNPRADDYAVPKRAHRAFPAAQSTEEEEEPGQGAEPEGEGEGQREELQDSPYTNVAVKM